MDLLNTLETTLIELRLNGVRDNLSRRLQQASQDAVGFEDFLTLLLQDERNYRKNSRITRLLKNAGFKNQASLESLDFSTPRGLDKKLFADLGGGRFIREGINVVIGGATGVGKTYCASAIGNAACRNGFTTFFFRMNTLMEQTALSRAKASYLNLVKKISACDLLILDDFGIKPLTPQQFQDLYDIIDERGEMKSTIVTTQLPVENWNEVIADPVTCEAVTDRIVSRAIRIQMKGPSVRGRKTLKKQEELDNN